MIAKETHGDATRVVFSRLPDIHSATDIARNGLISYGRFALLRDNTFWWGDNLSSHPRDTKTGWYWAIPSGSREIVVSARGCKLDIEELMAPDNPVIGQLLRELKRRRIL